MQNRFASAFSETISNHMPLSATRREMLARLALLIMRHGAICLWRLSTHGATRRRTLATCSTAHGSPRAPCHRHANVNSPCLA